MNPIDLLILIFLALVLVFAVRSIVRAKKQGKCVGCSGCKGCSGCSGGACHRQGQSPKS